MFFLFGHVASYTTFSFRTRRRAVQCVIAHSYIIDQESTSQPSCVLAPFLSRTREFAAVARRRRTELVDNKAAEPPRTG